MKIYKSYAEFAEAHPDKVKICWRCGNYHNGGHKPERSYCDECIERHKEEDKQLMDRYVEYKLRVMWRRAVNDIEKQSVFMDEYYDEAQAVLEMALEDTGKFQSSHEMMVAMELVRNRVRTKVQHKVLRYRVDFLIPDWKVALEIDGKLHDYKIKKDSDRDVAILTELNKDDAGWEIIRIPTKHIDDNLKQLVPAIKALYNERQRLRKKHGGFLPTYYSKHDTAQQMKVIKALNDEKSSQDVDILEKRFKHEWKPQEL